MFSTVKSPLGFVNCQRLSSSISVPTATKAPFLLKLETSPSTSWPGYVIYSNSDMDPESSAKPANKIDEVR